MKLDVMNPEDLNNFKVQVSHNFIWKNCHSSNKIERRIERRIKTIELVLSF